MSNVAPARLRNTAGSRTWRLPVVPTSTQVPSFCRIRPSRLGELSVLSVQLTDAGTVVMPLPDMVPPLQLKPPEICRFPAPVRLPPLNVNVLLIEDAAARV